MRIAWAVSFSVLLAVVGYGLYWQERLAPLMKAQGVNVVPTPFELVPVESVRPVNLGFAEFEVPAAITGEIVRHDDTLFVSVIQTPDRRAGLTIAPPTPDNDPQAAKFIRDYARLMEVPPPSLFEIQKRALYAQPFSVWSVPFRGWKRARATMVLLALKFLQTGSVSRLEVSEDSAFGVIVAYRPDFTEIQFTDKKAGVSQRFLLDPANEIRNAIELASTLARSYRFTTDLRADAELLPLLASTGITQRLTARRDPTSPDEIARLEAVAEEVRARRAKQDN